MDIKPRKSFKFPTWKDGMIEIKANRFIRYGEPVSIEDVLQMKFDPIANTVTLTDEEYLEFMKEPEKRRHLLKVVPRSISKWLQETKLTLEKLSKEN